MSIKSDKKWPEILEDRTVICHHGQGEVSNIIRQNKDKTYLTDHGAITCAVKPINASILHPFQREGLYTVEELDILHKEYRNGQLNMTFTEWLRERQQ